MGPEQRVAHHTPLTQAITRVSATPPHRLHLDHLQVVVIQQVPTVQATAGPQQGMLISIKIDFPVGLTSTAFFPLHT